MSIIPPEEFDLPIMMLAHTIAARRWTALRVTAGPSKHPDEEVRDAEGAWRFFKREIEHYLFRWVQQHGMVSSLGKELGEYNDSMEQWRKGRDATNG